MKHRETMGLSGDSSACRQKRNGRRKKQSRSEGIKHQPPLLKDKNEYLTKVGAIDCIKAYNKWKTSFGLVQELKDWEPNTKSKPQKKTCKVVPLAKAIDERKLDGKSVANSALSQMTKLERKQYYDKCKHIMHKTRDSILKTESDEEKDVVSVPSHFKRYTIQDRIISMQQPKREKPLAPGESYDGPEDAKRVDLANLGEDPCPVYIATILSLRRRSCYSRLLGNIETFLLGVIET